MISNLTPQYELQGLNPCAASLSVVKFFKMISVFLDPSKSGFIFVLESQLRQGQNLAVSELELGYLQLTLNY